MQRDRRDRTGPAVASPGPDTDIMTGIKGATWAPPFVMIDRIMHMDRDRATALVVFNGEAERFSYGPFTSPSLLVECMAQLSLALIRYSDPAVEIGIIPSLRDIVMTPPPPGPFEATIEVRWADGGFPRYVFEGTGFVAGAPVCSATLDILATREAGR
jgi:hypothetical protein